MKCIVWVNICIWVSLSTVVAESVNEGSITACIGKDVDFFCGLDGTLEVHIILIQHQSKEIGRYSTDTEVEVYPEFKDRYLIVKKKIEIQIRISDVKVEDKGHVSCTVIYKTKRVKHEWNLIIQERLTSSVIDFNIKIGDTCTILTCSANSNDLNLKKPDNESITGKDIVLDSCRHYLPPGEYSCCLMTNCSEAECIKKMLEDSKNVAANSSNNLWMILFAIESILVISVIVFVIFCKTRIFIKGTETTGSKPSQDTGKSPEFESQFPDTGICTINKKQQSDKSVKSTESGASGTSQCSDNLGFINEKTEQIPMVSMKY